MKVHLHRFLKYCTTLLVLLLLVTNCERDTHFETPQLEDNLKVRIVNSDEVPDLFNKLKKDAKFYTSKGDNQNLDLDLDKIVEVTDSTNHKNYSLNFKSVSTGKYFANVVVPQDSIGNFGAPLVYKYIPDDAFIEPYRDGELTLKDFYGTIEVYDFYEYVNTQEQAKTSYNSALPGLAPCNSIQINTPGLNGGDNSGNDGSSCTITTYVTTCWCKNELVGVHDHQPTVITYVINCSGDSDVDDVYQKSNYNPTGCGGGNNNNTNPIGINQPEVVPCLDDSNCYVDYINNVLSKLPNLTQEQADWIADFDNIQKVVQLSDFLDQDDSAEAINFATEALKAWMTNGEVDVDEAYIYTNTPDDNYIFQGEKQYISNPLILNNGKQISITFGTTKDLINANQPVSVDLINGLKFSLQEANNNLSSSEQITSIYIMCTTNGHGTTGTSNHLKSTAVDISRINNKKMILSGVTNQIIELQKAMNNYQYIRENFGPYLKYKYSIETNKWNYNYPIGGHKDHIHFSVRK